MYKLYIVYQRVCKCMIFVIYSFLIATVGWRQKEERQEGKERQKGQEERQERKEG